MLRPAIASLGLCVFLVAVSSVAMGQLAASPGGDPDRLIAVSGVSAGALEVQLETAGYFVWSVNPVEGEVEVTCSSAEALALGVSGLTTQFRRWAEPLADALGAGPEVPLGYSDLPAIEASLFATAAAYPNLTQLVDVSSAYGPGPTFEGRPIYALKISDNAQSNEDEPNILIVACHHPSEVINPEIALDIINRLTTGYGFDPVITALVDQNEIWVSPVWDPDGLEYIWATNNFWRKNRSPQSGGAIGVNLNRNYDLGFNSSCSGSSSPSNSNYKGPFADSEIETQTMVAFSRARRFAKVMDFHSSGREVLLSYVCSPLDSLIDNFISSEGTALANAVSWGTRNPSAEGEHQQWQIKETTSYAFLAETGTSFQPPHTTAMAEAAIIWPLIVDFLQRDIPLRGNITDASNGNPIVASLTIGGVNFQQGESRHSEALHGRYHLFLPAGSHQVTFQAPGYVSSTHTVSVGASGETVLDVAMVPVLADTGQPNSNAASLVISGAVDANGAAPGAQNGPYFASIAAGTQLTFNFDGPAGQPFLLLGGPLNRNNKIFAFVGSLDLGLQGASGIYSDVSILLNGQSPTSFLELLCNTGPSGTQTLSFPQSGFNPGLVGSFQVALFQPSGAPVVLSAATEVTFLP